MAEKKPWPTEIRLSRDKRTLTVGFDDGAAHAFSAEFLRVLSPSAEVQGHSPEQRVTVPGKRDVAIIAVEPVGNYAVRLTFDDMHNTGIFSWDYFLRLAAERGPLWDGYLADLAAAGLSREPIRPRT
ncbi:MAG: gamma-butyrobetaine hydroxylase-like domain-containing protein [Reyranella sp.]